MRVNLFLALLLSCLYNLFLENFILQEYVLELVFCHVLLQMIDLHIQSMILGLQVLFSFAPGEPFHEVCRGKTELVQGPVDNNRLGNKLLDLDHLLLDLRLRDQGLSDDVLVVGHLRHHHRLSLDILWGRCEWLRLDSHQLRMGYLDWL